MDTAGEEGEDADLELPAGVLNSKIIEYEEFVERVLKAELKRSLDDFRTQAEQLQHCRELRKNIGLLIQGNVVELETMVELGCQFYAKAFVPDTSRIFVDVGLGFRLELSLVEASEFLEAKEQHILGALELRKKRTARIKADIHEALHLLDLMLQVQSGGTPWLEGGGASLQDSFTG
mmetsp:Transcript_48174/g.111609  ORF Transcript_48174/g.111609 Transcript_48174/m.111609 type:complete len:177 (+) Transcript_48174:41-571(+)